jgi:hypothetical protein
MLTKAKADIVFCVDASASMTPCFKGVRDHISSFVSGLSSHANMDWDVRLDFVAHSICMGVNQITSLHNTTPFSLWSALYKSQSSGRFFTKDLAEFKNGLDQLNPLADEASLIALDFCLDFPWCDISQGHRAVVFLTDEALETGELVDEQVAILDELIDKIQTLKVMLYIVAPQSEAYTKLSEADRCEYRVVDQGNGLCAVDFKELLTYIGKSLSVSTLQSSSSAKIERSLFGQESWKFTDIPSGDDH